MQLTAANVILQANQLLRYRADSKEKMDAQITFTEALLSQSGSPSVRLVSFRSIDPNAEFPWLLLKAGTNLALHSYTGSNEYSDKVFASLFGDQPRSIIWADHIAENCPRPGEFITEKGRQTYEMLVQDIHAGRYIIDRVVRGEIDQILIEKGANINENKIGSQTWATKNLDICNFRNGDVIPEAKTSAEWKRAGKACKPAWCNYDNNLANGTKFGKLYNWYAVNDSRGLAPKGWHIPSETEWKTLTVYLGGEDVAGTKMKSCSGWIDNGNGTNESGFEGFPGGYRFCGFLLFGNSFDYIGRRGFWWSSTENFTALDKSHPIYSNYTLVNRKFFSKDFGCSVRCLMD